MFDRLKSYFHFLMVPLSMGFSISAGASMGNLATTFGLLPQDIATAQAYSLFSEQVSAAYYNPASLALNPRGELTVGALQVTPSLEVASKGGANPPTRTGRVLESEQTETVLFGMKTNLSSLTKFKTPVYLALMAGVEKYGLEMLAFESNSSEEGQFMQYGQKPLFLSLSGAVNVMPGIHVGAGVRITLHADATMRLETDLAGNTSNEELSVSAEPVLIPLFGMYFGLQDMLCADTKNCMWQGLDVAFSYRGSSNTQTTVDANAVIPGTVSEPGLPLVVSTLDAYQPMIISLGARYQLTQQLNVALTLEHQNWSDLTSELTTDTIKDQAGLKFENTLIPRLGLQYAFSESITLHSGLSFEASPLTTTQSEDVNLFDTDRAIAAVGLSKLYTETNYLAFPLKIDLAYQYHSLMERDFDLVSNGAVYETITASGDAHVASLSFSMMF